MPKIRGPERALLTLVVLLVTATLTAGASKADDLATAKQLMKKRITIFENITNLSFKGKSGKAYCKWVRGKLSVDQDLVTVIARNPDFKDSGRGLSHDQTIAYLQHDVAIAKSDVAKCGRAGL